MTRIRAAILLSVTAALLSVAAIPTNAIAQESGDSGSKNENDSGFNRAVRGLKFRSIGPAAISGRISDIAIHPDDPSTWYLATASGGLWKTTNAGTTFDPIADGEGSYSFGTIAIDPNDSDVVWAGSGENNPQRAVAYGDGVYKSLDGGRTWKNVGLENSEHIARILIDPSDSDVVYVAAQGPLWNSGGDRGLYKTTDGGESWAQLIDAVDEWTGVADAVMDPSNPDVLLASTWQRARRQWSLIAGGPKSALYRSTDGGATWTKSRGMPGGQIGRIGLAMSPVDSDVVYAIAESTAGGGFYRSMDGGVSFRRMSDRTTSSNYYQELFADPNDVDRVYSVAAVTAVSDDGGSTWENVGLSGRHVDDHVVWIDPDDSEHLIIGGDGGLYQSYDAGSTWDWFQNLPLAQFYRVAVDNSEPFYRVYGGTQDNSTMGGPSRTSTRRGADTGDWFLTQGGDGFVTRIDPTDPNIVYSESQYAGLTRFNLGTGERVSIQPYPELGEPALRWNWDTPLLISAHDPARLYVAAQQVFRSDDRGSNWTPISGDLTAQIDRNTLKLMGRVWSVDAMAKNRSTSTWNSLVSMAESSVRDGLIWVGSDDGVIQVTEDGGAEWRRIGSIRGIPDTTFVASLVASSHDVNTIYAAFDNHKSGDFAPYIAKSDDLGRSWTVISGGLPDKGTVYVLKEDHLNPDLLFAGTEYGVFASPDGGETWTQLKNGLPTIMVADMAIQEDHDDLVLGTFGRGFYVLDDLEILRELASGEPSGAASLLPVTDAPMFVASNPDPNWLGGRFWTADNPPSGARIFYQVTEAPSTREQRRKKAEAAARKDGEDVFYPPWDSLRAEDQEEAPKMHLNITDSEGRVVRRLTGPTSAGLHRVTWDLRYPSASPIRSGGGGFGGGGFGGGGGGPFVVPGSYTVSLAMSVDGSVSDVGEPQSFSVYPLHENQTPRTPEVLAFQRQAAELQRAVSGASAALGEANGRIGQLEQALSMTTSDVSAIVASLDALSDDLESVGEMLSGDPTRSRRNEPSPPSLMSRLRRFTGGAWSGSIHEVTGTQRRQYEIVAGEFEGILSRMRTLIEVDLKQIEDAAEEAGAPWTSGRIPVWRR